jgi:hypothetical protein
VVCITLRRPALGADFLIGCNPHNQPGLSKELCEVSWQNAEGRHFGGPSLISEKIAAASAGDLNSIITNGKGHMPKYAAKLTPEEIGTLVEQIKALNNK